MKFNLFDLIQVDIYGINGSWLVRRGKIMFLAVQNHCYYQGQGLCKCVFPSHDDDARVCACAHPEIDYPTARVPACIPWSFMVNSRRPPPPVVALNFRHIIDYLSFDSYTPFHLNSRKSVGRAAITGHVLLTRSQSLAYRI